MQRFREKSMISFQAERTAEGLIDTFEPRGHDRICLATHHGILLGQERLGVFLFMAPGAMHSIAP
jgi:hypothetical protein